VEVLEQDKTCGLSSVLVCEWLDAWPLSLSSRLVGKMRVNPI